MAKKKLGIEKTDGFTPARVGNNGPFVVKLATDQVFEKDRPQSVNIGVSFDRYVLATFASDFAGFTDLNKQRSFVIPPRTSKVDVVRFQDGGPVSMKARDSFLLVFPLDTSDFEA